MIDVHYWPTLADAERLGSDDHARDKAQSAKTVAPPSTAANSHDGRRDRSLLEWLDSL